MDWLLNLFQSIKTKISQWTSSDTPDVKSKQKVKQPLFNNDKKKTTEPNEISMMTEISDEQIQTNNLRSKYITTVKNPDHRVKKNENPEVIAKKYGVTTRALLAANNLDEQSAQKIQVGQVLKIPPSRRVKNVNNLSDIANAMGVSVDFIKKLKKAEDSAHLPEKSFHNTPYLDENGVKTIGIGHKVLPGDKTKLTNAEVCTLCAQDLLKAEEHLTILLGGQKYYDRIPQALKESVLDLTFNKGVIDDDSFKGLIYCLKNCKWEAAVNKLTFNKSIKTGEEMSGLNKRRLFDISLATKMYGKNIPQSNINTAQHVYNRGVELLRAECQRKNLNFANQLAGYNQDVQSYFGNRLKLKLITK